MKVTKYGHCCLKVSKDNITLLIDPGSYSIDTNPVDEEIDSIFISHEHADHLHIDSIKKLIEKNNDIKIYAGKSVGAMLDSNNIKYINISDKKDISIGNMNISFIHGKHAKIYETISPVDNIGIIVDNSFYYPGDNFKTPGTDIKTLALPVAGPWMKISEAVDFALSIKPSLVFPVHDGMLKFVGSAHSLPESVFRSKGISFIVLESGKEVDI